MQKLVSKNPVLRFKLGNQILKFDGGGLIEKFINYIKKIESDPNRVQAWGYSLNYKLSPTNSNVDKESEIYKKAWNKLEEDAMNKRGIYKPKSNTRSSITTTPRFLSKYSNMESTIGGANNIKAWLQKLKNYYAPGTYNPDSVWGANTQAAYDRYLADQAKLSVKFTVPSITDPTQNELSELDKRAKPITVNPTTTLLNEFALDKQTNYPSISRSTAQELFDKVILRDEFKTPYNPNFNWKNAPKLSYYPKLNYYYAKKGIKLIPRKKSNFRQVAQ